MLFDLAFPAQQTTLSFTASWLAPNSGIITIHSHTQVPQPTIIECSSSKHVTNKPEEGIGPDKAALEYILVLLTFEPWR